MLTWLAPIIVVVVVAVAITAKLLVRRRAPVGGWFTDLPRSAGSLSVIGTMFAVMLPACQGGCQHRGRRRD